MARIIGFDDNLHIPEMPSLTERQVKILEGIYPARCIGLSETIEEHLRYAGKVELIAQLREHISDPSGPRVASSSDEDDDEVLDQQARDLIASGILDD